MSSVLVCASVVLGDPEPGSGIGSTTMSPREGRHTYLEWMSADVAALSDALTP